MEYYSAIKKTVIIHFAAKWMELEKIQFTVVTKTQKEIHYMFSLIGGS